ncbi:MAG: hypothetical protein E6G68_09485 [Actinobacteria bacterium]|nr:MAG: hypothetical protein E6G68_09485 [Actinomycetota bacterium]
MKPEGAGSIDGARSVSRNTSAWISSAGFLPSPRMRNGTHGDGVGIVRWIGVPSPSLRRCLFAAFSLKLAAMKIELRLA